MPSIPELVYAALLYEDGEIPENPESKDFVPGTETEDGKLIFSFQRPDDTSGTFTLEIFAFVKTDVLADDGTTNFSRNSALFSGYKEGLAIVGDAIVVTDPIALSSNESGTVNLKIKVPDGCTLELKELKIDGTTEGDSHFAITGASPNFTINQNDENGILAGAYQVTFTVKKDEEIIYIFSEYINVINGLCTNTWWNGDVSSEVKDVSQSMSKTVYVRGSGAGWYDGSDYKDTATASDENSGSLLAPLATIQKAIDKIIAINDGASAYTIYVDGTFTATSSAALADFNAFSQTQKLSVKIAGFSASQKSVLDGGDMACGIVVGKPLDSSAEQKNMNLTLENLVIQNAKNPGSTVVRGGAIMLCCKADNLHTIKNCEIKNNRAAYGSAIYNEYGSLDLQGCLISGNKSSANGAVYIGEGAILTTSSDVRIENNSYVSTQYGGGVFVAKNSEFIMNGSTISGNTAEYGGGGVNVAVGGTFTMNGGTISGNTAKNGGGVCISANISGMGTFNMNGAASIPAGDDGKNDVYLNASGTNIATITVADDLTAASPVATITPSAYTEGMQVLSLASGAATTLAANCEKFEVSQAGWKIDEEGKLVLSPDIYVSESGDDTSGKGSQVKPFATLQKAFDLIQTLNSTVSYIVHISGTVKGKSELSADVSAQKISITGTTGAKLDGNQSMATLLTVSCSAPVEITNLTLTNNYITALYITSGANVTLGEGAAISKNSNIERGADGGGVKNEGTFIIDGGTISGNYVSKSNVHGGGVYSSGTFIMKGGEISGNYTSIVGSDVTGSGGGVYIAGGTFEMTGGTISGNRASSAGSGGGVYVSSSGTFMMGGSASIPVGEDGKNDVYLASGKTITVASDLFAESRPVATITPSAYTAGRQVLSAASGAITQDICDKFALSDEDWKIVSDGTNGVLKTTTVYVHGSDATWYESNNPTATASDTNAGTRSKPLATIQKAVEKIIDMNDGADNYTIYVDGMLDGTTASKLGTDGMADFSALDKNLTLTIKALSEITKATLDGGARFDADGTITNEGIGKRIIRARPKSGAFKLTLENMVITGGKTTGPGGGIYFLSQGGTLTMTGGEIKGNATENSGGGVYVESCTFTMEDGEISNNNAAYYGGGIYTSGALTVTGGTIRDNIAVSQGGGVCASASATVTLTNCEIKSCETTSPNSGNGGGGIYSLGTLIVTGGTISDCIAGRSGGGIYAYGGTVECSDGVAFSNCEATGSGSVGSGGGICINSGVTVNVSGCMFVLCKAGASGGGIWNAGELDVSNTSFTTCSASNRGGGICNSGGTVVSTNVTYSGCTASSDNNTSGF